MRWWTNIVDPREPGEDMTRLWHLKNHHPFDSYNKNLKGKRIGPPRGNEYCSQERLIEVGLVGIYDLDPDEDENEFLRNTPPVRHSDSPSGTRTQPDGVDSAGLSDMLPGQPSLSPRVQ